MFQYGYDHRLSPWFWDIFVVKHQFIRSMSVHEEYWNRFIKTGFFS